jgi:hypothetical protein
MTLNELKSLQASGAFHHATYRNFGTLWEGLWIYGKHEGCRGFDIAGSFPKNHPELEDAIQACKGHSVGSYGKG